MPKLDAQLDGMIFFVFSTFYKLFLLNSFIFKHFFAAICKNSFSSLPSHMENESTPRKRIFEREKRRKKRDKTSASQVNGAKNGRKRKTRPVMTTIEKRGEEKEGEADDDKKEE